MVMKILSLTLTNFKGVKSFCLDAQGEDLTVKGDNATGKTTLFDGFLWLLFDKDSQNRAKFDIKTLDSDNSPIHGVDHEVEAVLEINGKKVGLKKSFRETWTKKRGAATSELTGHTTEHFYNDVPISQKEYRSRIADIADEDTFKLLTNPKYFDEQLRWEKRRELLIEVCGDVSNDDVLETMENGDVAILAGVLNDHTIEEHKAIVKAQMKKINEELKMLPIRIDEVTKGLPDIEGLDGEQAQEKIELLKGSIRKKEQALSRIDSGGEVAEKTKLLREAEGELQQIKNAHGTKIQTEIDAKRGELNKCATDPGVIARLQKELEYNNGKIAVSEADMASLRQTYKAKLAQEFTFEQDDNCPTCGQSLPAEHLEAARQKAQEAFNQAKAKYLQDVQEDGHRGKAAVEFLKEENQGIETKMAELQKQQDQEEQKVTTLRKEIEALQEQTELPEEYYEQLEQVAGLEEAIEGLKAGSKDEKAKLYEEIAALEGSVRDAERVIANIATAAQGQARIAELAGQERTLAQEYTKLEQGLFLTEEFTRAKVALLEGKINKRFRYARFKLFNTLINGGIEECCETLFDGVPYSTGLNAGHQIVVGLDIISTLAGHYDFYPPVFVDNAESISILPEMEQQVIRLVKPEIETEMDRKKFSKMVVEMEHKKVKEAV